MTSRDDMVLTPRLDDERAAAPTIERSRRRVAGARRRTGLLTRAARVQAARRLARGRAVARPVTPGGGAGRLASRVIGASIVVAVAAALVIARQKSGRTFGGMGQIVKKKLLGDTLLRSIASDVALSRIASNPFIQRTAEREGITPQITRLHETFMEEALIQARSAAAFLEDPRYDVDSVLDLFVERGKQFLDTISVRPGKGR